METALAKIHARFPDRADKIRRQGGFVLKEDLPDIIATDRLMLLLVRCGNGRFMTPADQLDHFMKIVETSKLDYVRDVSLPTIM